MDLLAQAALAAQLTQCYLKLITAFERRGVRERTDAHTHTLSQWAISTVQS